MLSALLCIWAFSDENLPCAEAKWCNSGLQSWSDFPRLLTQYKGKMDGLAYKCLGMLKRIKKTPQDGTCV